MNYVSEWDTAHIRQKEKEWDNYTMLPRRVIFATRIIINDKKATIDAIKFNEFNEE